MKKILAIMVLVLFLGSSLPLIEARPTQSLTGVRPELVQEYNQAKEKYQETKQDWERSRQEYMKTKQSLRRTGTLKPTGQLEGNEEVHIERIKDFLTKTLKRMESHIQILEKWTEIVIEDENLKETILAQLEEDTNQLEIYQKQIEKASTIEELRTLGKEIKEFWKDVRIHLKRYHGIILSGKILNIIERSENASDKLHKKIDELDSNNKQVSEMQSLLVEYDDLIKQARERYEKAIGVYTQNAITSRNPLEEIKDYLKEANKLLREAHGKLRQIIKLYRDYTGNFPEPSLTATNTEYENSTV
jgi:tetratricopeptide (TPR) repeat protein